MTMTMTKERTKKPAFNWAIPEELGVPPDPLRLRLDFHHQATVMTYFEADDKVSTRLVSALDVAHALASELSFCSGLLTPGTLWWKNTKGGPVSALYVKPQVWKVALQQDIKVGPRRFTIPLPGLIFLCTPGKAPWVFAVKKEPARETDKIYKAPLCNIFATGQSCPGSHRYPTSVADMVQSFFVSFFSPAGDMKNRSRKFPQSVIQLWEFLDKKKRFPVKDLVDYCLVRDLMEMEI